MNTKFAKVSNKEWIFSGERDWTCKSFSELVGDLKQNINICQLKRNQSKKHTGYYRVLIKVKAPASLVNAFHSSEFGYRAQFYRGIKIGEDANRYIIDQLSPALAEQIKHINKRTCSSEWALKSLAALESKIWIHQGIWLRKKETNIRNLKVERWLSYLDSDDKAVYKKVIWGMLVPREDRLDIKGGFVSLDGQPLKVKMKPDRSQQINKYGFT